MRSYEVYSRTGVYAGEFEANMKEEVFDQLARSRGYRDYDHAIQFVKPFDGHIVEVCPECCGSGWISNEDTSGPCEEKAP